MTEQRPERKVFLTSTNFVWDLIEQYSSLNKLIRVTAYIYRFVFNLKQKLCRKDISLEPLTTTELKHALNFWIKSVQSRSFPEELNSLQAQTPRNSKSPLLKLQPFLDSQQLLRVGGRLQNAPVSYTEMHLLILPKHSPLSTLIIEDAHRITLHGGETITSSYVRRKYWIVGLRILVRACLRQCIPCFKQRATACSQIMAHLPSERVTRSRPFFNCGVDYADPLTLCTHKGRGYKSFKGYIALFVCFAVKAIHLEVVSDLSSQGFLAAFKRFTSRRGIPGNIFSDNGTNFIGANRQLVQDLKLFNRQFTDAIAQAVTWIGSQWHFIPASSPHFGGLWEAGVKSVKHHLRRVIGDNRLTFEEMTTLLCQIEATLNSRPLYPLSQDPTDCEALTPGHFLVGTALNTVPEPSLLDTPEHRLNRWQFIRQIHESFWKTWNREYLHTLQQRSKWNAAKGEVHIGDLVLVKEDHLPPSHWLLGRIIELHPGSDGRTRVVTIRSRQTTFRRPIVKVCVLPVSKADDPHPLLNVPFPSPSL